MTSADIRQSFLEYFKKQGHRLLPSSSLVPSNDPTLLFTNAGMNQFKELFLGTEQRNYQRATTAQKCMRVSGKHNDLNNVGPSLRHHTFFEMLGNFSFGDYFKTEAIHFAWTLLTDIWQLPPARLYATVFEGSSEIPRDDEAYSIWLQLLPASRIAEMGVADNFWAMGDTGPCGRCSEIHYYRGSHLPCSETPCRGIDCNCDRYVEIWNNVFMEFDRQENGALKPLHKPSIDTGMGLERIVAVLQDKLSNYDTDLFTPLLEAVGKRAGVSYQPLLGRDSNNTTDVSLRVIADHLRAMTLLIGDGVTPSNEWRGYVLRKIMRRAMRHGKKLGLEDPFLHELVNVVVVEMGSAYPELSTNQATIVDTVRREEKQFDKVLTDGLPRLEDTLMAAEQGDRTVSGNDAFRLYDTFGLPLDFIEDLAESRQITVNRKGFDIAMEAQRSRARASTKFAATDTPRFTQRPNDNVASQIDNFIGYSDSRCQTTIKQLFRTDGTATTVLTSDETGFAILDVTPFYLEAGGQVSDTGSFSTVDTGRGHISNVVKPIPNWPRMHIVTISESSLHVGADVLVEVDASRRNAIRRNHTATHLLHAALREVIGEHVKQAGSLVAPDRLRFDVTNHEPITVEQISKIERIVNTWIIGNQPVHTQERSIDEAIADGAMALFGEKYGDLVRVVNIGDFSMELCGGTHCSATGDIGTFVVTHEGGVAAGVRRLEAVTGEYALRLVQERNKTLNQILDTLGTTALDAIETVKKLQLDTKQLSRDLEQLKVKAAFGMDTANGIDCEGSNDRLESTDIHGIKLIARRVSGLEQNALRTLADKLRDRLGSGVVILAADTDGKAAIVVTVTHDLTDRVHAGQLVKTLAPIVGGRGGGRPDFAQAGGRQVERLDDIIQQSRTEVERILDS